MNSELLLKLADKLLELDNVMSKENAYDTFDLSYWKIMPYEDVTDLSNYYDKYECGTVCCAIGWFPVLLPDEAKKHKFYVKEFHGVYLTRDNERIITGWEAVSDLFDISYRNSMYLFSTEYYENIPESEITPRHVANRIKDFVKEKANV